MSLLDQVKRQGDNGAGLKSMIVLSALLHALVLFVAFFSPSLPTPSRIFVPAYTVDLVTMPAEAGESRTPAVSSEEEIRIGERETAVAARKPPEKTKAVPIERIEVQRRDVPERLDEALRRIQERVASGRPQASVSSPGPRGTPTSGASPDADVDRMNAYYSALWVRIKEQWALPEAILSGGQLEAVVAVTIMRDGSISGLAFEKRSGNRVFDESVESAVRKAEPFPPLPGWLNEPHIEVGIRFRSSDYR